MKTLSFLLSLCFIFAFSMGTAQTIDTDNSKIMFEVTNMKLNDVDGTFGGMKGEIAFSADDLANASFNVCIDAASVNTDSEKRDHHLRNEDFFDVEKYPTICFVSESITKSGDEFVAKGKLTLLKTTKEVEIPFTFDGSKFVGRLEILRLEYGLGADTGTFMVGDEISITINCTVK